MQHDLKIEIIHIKMQHNYFNRLESLIGIDKVSKLKDKTVLIIGIGGVGGYVLESLTRSNVGTIIIVDYDVVDETNINRQILALTSTIGKKKVDVAEKRIKDINPNCKVIKYDDFFDKDTKEKILNNDIDFIIDTCDSIASKKLVINEALNRNIDFISCMGTSNKLDPTMFEIVDIRATKNDPIARIIRKFVKDEKYTQKIMVLSSKEVPLSNGKILASNSFVPTTAGLLIGNYVINKLIK